MGTYNLSSFLKSDEEVLRHLLNLGVGSNTTGLVHDTPSVLVLPINAALNLTLEVAGVLARQEGHLDVAVRVGLQLTLHGFKEEFVTTIRKKVSDGRLMTLTR